MFTGPVQLATSPEARSVFLSEAATRPLTFVTESYLIGKAGGAVQGAIEKTFTTVPPTRELFLQTKEEPMQITEPGVSQSKVSYIANKDVTFQNIPTTEPGDMLKTFQGKPQSAGSGTLTIQQKTPKVYEGVLTLDTQEFGKTTEAAQVRQGFTLTKVGKNQYQFSGVTDVLSSSGEPRTLSSDITINTNQKGPFKLTAGGEVAAQSGKTGLFLGELERVSTPATETAPARTTTSNILGLREIKQGDQFSVGSSEAFVFGGAKETSLFSRAKSFFSKESTTGDVIGFKPETREYNPLDFQVPSGAPAKVATIPPEVSGAASAGARASISKIVAGTPSADIAPVASSVSGAVSSGVSFATKNSVSIPSRSGSMVSSPKTPISFSRVNVKQIQTPAQSQNQGQQQDQGQFNAPQTGSLFKGLGEEQGRLRAQLLPPLAGQKSEQQQLFSLKSESALRLAPPQKELQITTITPSLLVPGAGVFPFSSPGSKLKSFGPTPKRTKPAGSLFTIPRADLLSGYQTEQAKLRAGRTPFFTNPARTPQNVHAFQRAVRENPFTTRFPTAEQQRGTLHKFKSKRGGLFK